MKTILIIQEDKTIREGICDFLKEEGYVLISAADGITGLQLAINHQPDLILCDIIMPGINGCDFYKTIKQIKTTSTIPLIFLTSKAEKENIRAGMYLGADDYITIPFDFNELLFSVETRLNKIEKIQQKSDEKFYTLIDNSISGVFIYSKNKFEFVNEKCAKIFGLSRKEISEISFKELMVRYRENKRQLKSLLNYTIDGHKLSFYLFYLPLFYSPLRACGEIRPA